MKTYTFKLKDFNLLKNIFKGYIFWRVDKDGICYLKGPGKFMDRLNARYNN